MGFQWDLLSEIVEDGMLTGYLLDFCNAHFCSENFEFLLTVKRFKYLFPTKIIWKSFQQLDNAPDSSSLVVEAIAQFNSVFDETHQNQILQEITNIWKLYLDPTSATAEVCLSYDVIENTKGRMEQFTRYGPEVFAEATIEPTKSMVRDIVPRYMASVQYTEMLRRKQMQQSLPSQSSLYIVAPRPNARRISHKTRHLTHDTAQAYMNDLENYTKDNILYEHFLIYLRKSVSSENLLCLRAIDVFEQCFSHTGTILEEGLKMAWDIYLYFICKGSSYEISRSNIELYDIGRKMHNPCRGMFDVIYRSTRNVLVDQFNSFRNTTEFHAILPILLERSKQLEAGDKINSDIGSVRISKYTEPSGTTKVSVKANMSSIEEDEEDEHNAASSNAFCGMWGK
jgi:hypothetical protein